MRKGIASLTFTVLTLIILNSVSCVRQDKSGESGSKSVLVVADSLGWQDDENFTFGANNIHNIDGEELYVLDIDNAVFYVYEINSLKFLRKFGSKGRGPGEFLYPNSFTFDKNGDIVVGDFANSRIQWISKQGDFLKAEKFHPIGKVYNYEDSIYVTTAHFAPDYKLTVYNNGEFKTVRKLDQFCSDNDLKEENKHIDIIKYENSLIGVPINRVGCIKDLNNEKIQFSSSVNRDAVPEYSKTSNAVLMNDRFYVVERAYGVDPAQKKNSSLTKIEDIKHFYDIREFVCEYSITGELKSSCELPGDMMTLSGEILSSNGKVFLVSNYNGIIFKLTKSEVKGS